MTKLFVWDFHGVLEKNNEYAVQEVCNRALSEFGIEKKVTVQECLNLYGKKWSDYFKYLCPEHNEEKIHTIVDKAIEISIKERLASKYIKPTNYAHDVLNKTGKKHMNIILSNSSPKALDMFLEMVDMQNIFKMKYGADGHRKNAHEKNSKEVWLKKYLSKRKFENIIFIDDSKHGIEMGKKLNGTTYLYRHSGRSFEDIKADYQINDLREILKEI